MERRPPASERRADLHGYGPDRPLLAGCVNSTEYPQADGGKFGWMVNGCFRAPIPKGSPRPAADLERDPLSRLV